MSSAKSRCSMNDLAKLMAAKHADHQRCLRAFILYVKCHEKCRREWQEKDKEYQNQLKTLNKDKDKQIKALTKERDNLDTKLRHARRMIDEEKLHRKRTEEDRCHLEQQLQVIHELLHDNRNKLHDETRDKLQYLSVMDQRLSTINETFYHDTTGSCLSDLSYSRSEDDLDAETMRITRRLRKSRAFSVDEISATSPKKARSSINTGRSDVIRARPGECLVATTRVDIGNGVPTASSIIETYPSSRPIIPPLDPVKPTAPQLSCDSGDSEFGNNQNKGDFYSNNNAAFEDQNLLSPNGFIQFENTFNSRAHCLLSKTVIRPEICDPCGKKIKFGRLAVKCSDCRTVCHTECKSNLRLPCIPPGSATPTTKDSFGIIADYAPPTIPMIPAIVIHCINEIEKRGLTETGLYRISGAEKEVKGLKEKMLKGRGVPNLSLISDIHVITGCMKDFFRSLQEPIATFTERGKFVNAIQENRDLETRHAALYQVFTSLPQPNKDTLAFLILHLQRVAEVKECKMPISSLAQIMGPTVIGYSRPDTETMKLDIFEETHQAVMVMEELLSIPTEYWKKSLIRCTPMPCTPSTGSLRDKCGFLDSPMASGRFTVRKKKL